MPRMVFMVQLQTTCIAAEGTDKKEKEASHNGIGTSTRFFHAKAAGRARCNAIRVLEVDGMALTAHGDKVAALTTYYAGILGRETGTT